MYNESKNVSQENVYSKLISSCQTEIANIRDVLGFVTNPGPKETTGVLARTLLERELSNLLENIKDLKNDIVI